MIGIGLNIWRNQAGSRLGPELVVNGDFGNGATGWTLGTNWAVSAGLLVATAAAQDSFTKTTAGVVIAGKSYQIKIDAPAYTSGGWKVLLEGGANVFGDKTGSGSFTAVVPVTVTGSLYIWANALLTAAFDNVSVREVLPPT